MNYLTNYYKNLSEQLQAKVNHLQNLLETNRPHDAASRDYAHELNREAEEIGRAEPFYIKNLDRVEGHEDAPDGWGAKYHGVGADGKEYAFWHTGSSDLPKIGRIMSDSEHIQELEEIKPAPRGKRKHGNER
jgi:hypothetical protein